MAELRYALAVLSHGNPGSPYAERTLRSFMEHVHPRPELTVRRHDGPGNPFTDLPDTGGRLWRPTPTQVGFCRATAGLWEDVVSAAEDIPYVFWLEHDFVFDRPVDLAALAAILSDRRIAQVSLMRQPVNAQEKRRGRVLGPDDHGVTDEDGWLRHDRYFTTNPSLMRTEFMREQPFAAGPSKLPYDIECEGRYGRRLIEAGYQFAVMGDGTPWVEHIGTRDGKGY